MSIDFNELAERVREQHDGNKGRASVQDYSRKLNAKVHREIARARNKGHNQSVDFLG